MSVLREDAGDGVTILTLNRPEALNALDPASMASIRGHLEALATETETVGCIVVRGAGRSFCAGVDLKAMGRGETERTEAFSGKTLDLFESAPQPVIFSVHGHCYTGGLEMALTGDLLICAEDARFADTHAKWGLVPSWGMTQRLPRRVGLMKARELMYTGRMIRGDEAVAIGLANMAVPADELEARTMELARAVTANVWHSLRGYKTLTRGGLDRSLTAGLDYERDENPGRAPDYLERVAKFNA